VSISAVWVNRLAELNDALVEQAAMPLATYLPPESVPDANWVDVSPSVAAILGWPLQDLQDLQKTPEALRAFSGQAIWPGMRSMATVYSGHQFGQWAGQLGDGRAHLLGEVKTPTGSQEIQLKGAGRTPYSRGGDGRAVLRSSIREYLCSEAMHGLGIPTTRALCLTASSLPVFRETPETAAIVTRVAPSFLRFGHFEHFAYHAAPSARATLQALVAFVLREHLPHLPVSEDAAENALTLLAHACESTADLMAQWQSVGFCHGVMNTDNMSILGLTMDYGPFGFLDAFDPDHICNHSDTSGRYSWRNQPEVAWWNVAAVAQALSVLVPGADDDKGSACQGLMDTLGIFPKRYREQMHQRWQAKLGLTTNQAEDASLIQDWLALLAQGRVDFTIAFRRLGQWQSHAPVDAASNAPVRDLFLDRAAFDAWALRYKLRLQAESSVDTDRRQRMDSVNPWVVLRNHLAQQAIERAQVGDYAEVKRLREVLASPYEEQAAHIAYADFPPDWSASLSVSCSS